MNLCPKEHRKGPCLLTPVPSVLGTMSNIQRLESWGWQRLWMWEVSQSWWESGVLLTALGHPAAQVETCRPAAAQLPPSFEYTVLQGRCHLPGIQKLRPHTEDFLGFQKKGLWDSSLAALPYFTLTTTLKLCPCDLYFTYIEAEAKRSAYVQVSLASNLQCVHGRLQSMPGVIGMNNTRSQGWVFSSLFLATSQCTSRTQTWEGPR